MRVHRAAAQVGPREIDRPESEAVAHDLGGIEPGIGYFMSGAMAAVRRSEFSPSGSPIERHFIVDTRTNATLAESTDGEFEELPRDLLKETARTA